MPGWPVPALLLALALAGCWRVARRDGGSFARFAALADGAARTRTLLRWTRRAALLFLVQPLVGLALLGRWHAIGAAPPEFLGLMAETPALPPLSPMLAGAVLAAFALGGVLGGLLAARRRAKGAAPPPVAALDPRDRTEALAVALLGAHAAVAEELFFRLYVPLLLVLLGVPALAAFAGTVLLFAAMHRYQGRIGVGMTGLLGALFAFAYLASGGLVLPVALHLAINANALLLRPAVRNWASRRRD